MKKILILLTAAALTLTAQTFNISTTAEFRTALENAAMNGEDDTIILSDGTYKTTDDGGGRFEYLDNEIYDLTLIGSNRENVILSGDGQNDIFRHQSIDGGDLKVEKISFIDGGPTFDVNGQRSNDGGAIYTELATIDIIDCNFTNNHARQGGAIYSAYNAGDTNISNTIFTNNTAWDGGGFYTSGSLKKVIVDNSTFINNTSFTTGTHYNGGGGFHANTQMTVTVSDSNFTNNTSYSSGGGFYCQVAEVSNSNFIANKACVSDTSSASNGTGGGGFDSSRSVKVLNSYFDKNVACHGGGFSSYYTTVIDSVFTDNNATDPNGHGGGGFSASSGNVIISRSTFSQNYSKSKGGGFVAFGSVSVITNSIFTNNRADGVGAGLCAGKFSMSNSIIANNTNGVYLYQPSSATDPYIIKNSLFIDNYITDVSSDPQSDISGVDGAVVSINNNYIDSNNIHVQNLKSNNTFTGTTLGFTDQANENYHLITSSDLIDTGTNDFADKFIVDGVNYLAKDYEENNRSVGANMDIGIYEYSTTKPTINSFTFSADAKTLQEVTFYVDYTLTAGRSIREVSFDYLDDGTFTADETHIFSEAKTYKVTVKITDDTGEFSQRTTNVLVVALPYDEMTDAQRLINATDPLHYQDILSIIEQGKVDAEDAGILEGRVIGEEYVQNNLPEFGLLTEADRDAAVTTATLEGVTTGREYVQDNLEEFGFIDKSTVEFTTASLATLPLGWSLVGISLDMTDLSVFDAATIVWSYDNSTSSWGAYSSDAEMKRKITDMPGVNLLNIIPAGSGVWIEK